MNQDESSLIEFGAAVRARRKLRGLTLRDLAERTGVSTSYLSSVERGVNPSTGRPPQISARFAERLRQVLGMGDVPVFASRKDEGGYSTAGHACEHVLLYRLDEGRGGLAGHVAELTSGAVSDWICIADPAAPEDVDAGPGFHGWTWSFGSDPYPDEFLDPTRIVTALEARVAGLDLDLAARGYGLIIADCSAVMRWVVNPDAEIDFEDRWCDLSGDALARALGHAPAVNVCVYHQSDFEVLASRVDVLDTLLQLLESHGRIAAVLPDGTLAQGASAVRAILSENRPSGISASAWRSLCKAAAHTVETAGRLHAGHGH